jgi:hypothetical protein
MDVRSALVALADEAAPLVTRWRQRSVAAEEDR